MTSSDPFYWRTFNVLLRLLGLGATFAGVVVATTFGLGIPALAGVEPTIDYRSLAAGIFLALLGLGFLMIPPFRPDLGDVNLFASPFRAHTEPKRRRWWTGDRLDA
jgi:hypothetical protein